MLIVYGDDIIVIEDETKGLKSRLENEFKTKDFGNLRNFLGIEVGRSNNGIVALDLLEETGMIGYKPAKTPIDPNHKLRFTTE